MPHGNKEIKNCEYIASCRMRTITFVRFTAILNLKYCDNIKMENKRDCVENENTFIKTR